MWQSEQRAIMFLRYRSAAELSEDEIKNITIYANNLLKEHSKTYNCKLYKIKFSNNSSRYGHDILI